MSRAPVSSYPIDKFLYHIVELKMQLFGLTFIRIILGKVTVIRREVCVEEDVVLDCDAKHRTNPRKLKRLMWHVKNTSSSNNDISWSPVVDSDGLSMKSGDGFRMNENGSLSLQSRVRDEGEVLYRCAVSKNVDSPREMHVVVLKNIKCGVLRRENGKKYI